VLETTTISRAVKRMAFRSAPALGLCGALVFTLTISSGGQALAQQDWPNRAVKLVVPFGAGGSADRLGRIAAEHFSKVFKQQFYVENRVGAGGSVATKEIVRADADGYTLLVGGSGSHTIGPAENPQIGYDPINDFVHIAMIGGESFAFSAQASLGVRTFKDLVALSKSRSEPLNIGTPGTASLGQLMVEQMHLRNIANFNQVSYRGGAPLLVDFFGNHIPVAATPIVPIIQQAELGAIVPLAVTSPERIAALKNVPTFAEIGYPEMTGAIWFWVAGPKGLAPQIVKRLNEELRSLIASPETRQVFEKNALLSVDADSPTLTKRVVEELDYWKAFFKDKGSRK
jgi:tripartite-type tricarboxylate transporter receptor subunit TctC